MVHIHTSIYANINAIWGICSIVWIKLYTLQSIKIVFSVSQLLANCWTNMFHCYSNQPFYFLCLPPESILASGPFLQIHISNSVFLAQVWSYIGRLYSSQSHYMCIFVSNDTVGGICILFMHTACNVGLKSPAIRLPDVWQSPVVALTIRISWISLFIIRLHLASDNFL